MICTRTRRCWRRGAASAAALIAARALSAAPPPPAEVVAAFHLATNYTQCILVEGLPVVGSARVSPFALTEAEHLIRKQIGHRPELLHAMASNRVRFVVMATTEMTTDVPEHSDLKPAKYWNRRARGLGATPARPAVSCGEENLLGLKGDPYSTENILVHEFGHAIQEMGLTTVDPTFDGRLKAVYEHARTNGLWRGTYAMQNPSEYWAEGTQSWFDTNRSNDHDHGSVDTREEVKAYDPDLAKLLTEVYGDGPWRYQRPATRSAADRAHLAGFDPASLPPFRWPESAVSPERMGEALAWLQPDDLPRASPRSGPGGETAIVFVNRRSRPVTVEWIDFDGRRKACVTVRPGLSELMTTFPGHVWMITEDGIDLGGAVAVKSDGRVEIRP